MKLFRPSRIAAVCLTAAALRTLPAAAQNPINERKFPSMRLFIHFASLFLALFSAPVYAHAQLFVTADSVIPGFKGYVTIGRNSQNKNFYGVDATITGDVTQGINTWNDSTLTAQSITVKGISAFDSSKINLTNVKIPLGYGLFSSGTSDVTIQGGQVSSVGSISAGTMTLNDVDFNNQSASNDGTGILNIGGAARNLPVVIGGGSGTTNISGGRIDTIASENSGVVNIGGTTVATYTSTSGVGSTMNITGGTVVHNSVAAYGITNITGGAFGTDGGDIRSGSGIIVYNIGTLNFGGAASTNLLKAVGKGTANITGGTIGDIYIGGQSDGVNDGIFNLYGGKINQNTIRASNEGILNLYGTGLTLSSALGRGSENGNFYTDYLITGRLQNGDALNTHFYDFDRGLSVGDPNSGTGNLRFFAAAAAPEPATIALLALPLLSLAVRQRRRA